MATDPKSIELLPCPFCGAELTRGSRRINPNARCTTADCYGAKMPVVNLDVPDSVLAWNTRTASRQIVGTVVLRHSNQIPGHEDREKECICCPGFPSHIYGVALELPPYEPNRFPEHFGRSLDYWVQSQFEFKEHEGRQLRVTVELLPDALMDDMRESHEADRRPN